MALDADTLRELLRAARRIAVVGLSPRPERPSHQVSAYLQRAGYQIVPVNPVGGTILGEPAHPDLRAAAATGPIDIVDIFRRPEHIPPLVDDCIRAAPDLVWMQQGVTHEAAAERLQTAGIPVIMDRCLATEHRRLGL